MTNLIFVLQLFKALQIILQHCQKDILVILKHLSQMNNLNTIKLMNRNALVLNVAQTYDPDITEPFSLSNYNTPTQDITLHQIIFLYIKYT